MQRPLMPPPTTTQSTEPTELGGAAGFAAVDSPAMEQRMRGNLGLGGEREEKGMMSGEEKEEVRECMVEGFVWRKTVSFESVTTMAGV